jgi:CYTH domain-containing protein
MPREVERKFLVAEPPDGSESEIEQGYVAIDGDREVRVRMRDGAATLTVKAGGGLDRFELELALDAAAYAELRAQCGQRVVRKRRRVVPLDGALRAEVDVYEGALAGLAVVEVEFPSVGASEAFAPPAWFGREVTGEDAYSNRRLACEGLPSR